jgi:ATP-dependent DNA helicase RecG
MHAKYARRYRNLVLQSYQFDAGRDTGRAMDVQDQAIADLLTQPEDRHLAFVRANTRPGDLAQTLAAMANGSGGTVVIGMRGRQVEGVTDADAARAMVLDAALACTPPLVLPLPAVVAHNGATLLVVTVPSGLPHVYSVNGTYLRREGSTNAPLPPDMLRHLLIERGETSWDRMTPANATLADLDPDKIAAYARRVGPIAEADPLAFLVRRGCLVQRCARR